MSSNDPDDLESNLSSSSMTQETIGHDQEKYFHRKRRLLAAEQTISLPENDYPLMKKCNSSKKSCLDQIVDSLNQKAQAEQDDDDKHLPSNPDNSTGDDDEDDQHLNIEDENYQKHLFFFSKKKQRRLDLLRLEQYIYIYLFT